MTRALAALLLATLPAAAQDFAGPQPFLTIETAAGQAAFGPRDIAAIEISESGGITDLFLRFDRAAGALPSGPAPRAEVRVCGRLLLRAEAGELGPDTLYLPNRTAVEAEAIRALWHGRADCGTLAPEVFDGE